MVLYHFNMNFNLFISFDFVNNQMYNYYFLINILFLFEIIALLCIIILLS